MVRKSIKADLELLDYLDAIITRLELDLERTAKVHDPQSFFLVKTVPGVGKVIRLPIHPNRDAPFQAEANYKEIVDLIMLKIFVGAVVEIRSGLRTAGGTIS